MCAKTLRMDMLRVLRVSCWQPQTRTCHACSTNMTMQDVVASDFSDRRIYLEF